MGKIQDGRVAKRSSDGRFQNDGKSGGFKPGVCNGPEPRTDRGRRRAAARKGNKG